MVQIYFKTLSNHSDPRSLLMSECHNSYFEGRHFLYLFLLLRVSHLGAILLPSLILAVFFWDMPN